MADLPPYPDTGNDTGVESGRGATTGTPRWVSVVGLILAIGLVLLVVILHLTGSIGPGAH